MENRCQAYAAVEIPATQREIPKLLIPETLPTNYLESRLCNHTVAASR
jgi:hypothetical protein